MAQVPYPLGGAEDFDQLKQRVWELIRQLYEEKMAGLDVGDVLEDEGGVLTLKLYSAGGLRKTNNQLSIKLDGTSLSLSSNGLKLGQSAFIADPTGGDYVDAQSRAVINSILDLLTARGLMAAS